jgi:hypothetical protein
MLKTPQSQARENVNRAEYHQFGRASNYGASALTLLVPNVLANHPDLPVPADDLAVTADLLH